jgi:hypothetical protein
MSAGWPFKPGDKFPPATAAEMNAIIRAAVREALDQERAEQPEPEAPAERWQAGDVVRNADSGYGWVVWASPTGIDGLVFFSLTNPGGAPFERAELPANLTLIVRDGHPVLPEPTDDQVDEIRLVCETGGDLVRHVIAAADETRGVIRP